MRLRDIDAIAVTVKPGIPTSLLIGLNFGKYLSEVGCKPLIPIHHMEAHALTARIVEKIEFPYLTLLISGGHCLLAIVENVDKFYLLGTTMDIAPGDILDKAGRRMKLNNIPDFQNMCGGAAIELAANQATDMEQFQFPLTLMHQKDCNFSYTGLLNTIYLYINEQEKEHNIQGDMIIPDVYNLCAGIQFTIARHLCHRTQRAMEFFNSSHMVPEGNRTLVVSGGVASNNFFAKSLSFLCSEMGYKFFRPPHKLCTDNGIMVAWNGMERWKINSGVLTTPDEIDKLKVEHKSPLGTDWREYVIDKNIKCTWVKVKRAHAN
ncbi:probable tRNA N6-adenosine threonylcarbamoyltransferase, mitochondrial [Orussus abietinus]|uniref:probable tRNA N6-adenosine threonylcarbamoyltransferase, mitochondrial n=1 Tax=Orussus abietinus TaxID=222816 RepID=UPI000C715E5F|nr:probable tRNA N6-adenosine threonylcarbamoyltransferase, mitochondrial [Orussus abietinus]